jgi:hypothetical protein
MIAADETDWKLLTDLIADRFGLLFAEPGLQDVLPRPSGTRVGVRGAGAAAHQQRDLLLP